MKSIKSRGGLTTGRRMTESVRHQWVFTNPACTATHDAMTKITNLSLLSSEQNVEMGKTRKEHSQKDLLTLCDWLSTHSPFDAADDRLRSISSGLTVPDSNRLINCDNTEGIGEAIQVCVVACTCNPATQEAEFRNGVGSIPVGGNSSSIGGWIV